MPAAAPGSAAPPRGGLTSNWMSAASIRPPAESDGALDNIAQLAHVPRPVKVDEYPHGFRGDSGDVLAGLRGLLADKMFHQRRNVLLVLA